VGNGGFSLRSRRLLDACLDDHVTIPNNKGPAEDQAIGNDHRQFLETKYHIQYAPEELARQFSFELGRHEPSFGFHGLWNIFNLMPSSAHDYFYTRIDYTGWNHYKWHHVLSAVIRQGRMDIYEYMLGQLIANSPELLDSVAGWLEQDSRQDQTSLVIN
jgi:hypothetical protein